MPAAGSSANGLFKEILRFTGNDHVRERSFHFRFNRFHAFRGIRKVATTERRESRIFRGRWDPAITPSRFIAVTSRVGAEMSASAFRANNASVTKYSKGGM
jgi:hypothetical protein